MDVVVFAGALALLGIFLIKMGFWPRRPGGGLPRCAKCDYLVVKIASERCPECGSVLAGKGTVFGARRRRLPLWLSGVLMVLIALGWGGPHLYRVVPWYHFAPMWWVMRDVKSSKLATSQPAWRELMLRRAKGDLSNYWRDKLVDAILAGEVNVNPWPQNKETLRFLWEEYLGGRLSASQGDGFFRELARVQWKVRPVVLAGQDAPYRGEGLLYLPNGWVMSLELEGGDGRRIYESLGTDSWYVHGADGRLKGSAKDKPGDYEIDFKYSAAFYRSEGTRNPFEVVGKQKPIWVGNYVDRAKVSVVEKGDSRYLSGRDAPELAEAIKGDMKIDNIYYTDAGPEVLLVHVHANRVVTNLAFEVFARADGKEYKLGELSFSKGMGHFGSGWSKELPPGVRPKKVDLIFRGSEDVAARTIGMFDYWKGEVVLKDVEIKEGRP